jgi:N-carbamoylputrescine amidase
MQRSHAVANGVFVVAVNRVGREGDLVFWGGSFVAAPDGRVLAEAKDGEEVLVVPCDLAEIDVQRQGWPFFRDRRTDAYGPLTSRWLEGDAGAPGG